MNRVVRAGGRVVIGDEGVAPWLRNSEIGRMLIRNNALYACEVPLGLLPETARSRVSWELCNTFYVIEFSVARDRSPSISTSPIWVREAAPSGRDTSASSKAWTRASAIVSTRRRSAAG